MEGALDSGLEIRRILLLTRLRTAKKGLTMQQIVRDCEKVPGWDVPGKTSWELARLVLQTLIDDRLVRVREKFELATKGLDYLDDPSKWRMDRDSSEDIEQKLFWESIYNVFDKAYRRLRPRAQTDPIRET